jgi:hypothetical protein
MSLSIKNIIQRIIRIYGTLYIYVDRCTNLYKSYTKRNLNYFRSVSVAFETFSKHFDKILLSYLIHEFQCKCAVRSSSVWDHNAISDILVHFQSDNIDASNLIPHISVIGIVFSRTHPPSVNVAGASTGIRVSFRGH